MSNSDLERYVRHELHWDPKIDDSAERWSEHDQAVDAALVAPGITRVNDHIVVLY